MAKPRIFKADDGWSVELPAFGFAAKPIVKPGFPSRERAGEWLAKQGACGSASQLAERASVIRSRYSDMNVPMVIR
ncbi:MAG TPA: hypothetical protein VHX38_02060 [Pseudonocardiaceae bacterium]|jgi:hypothetical protein|nr:hypothetical protein [Pseudonocardiaceae bacterium]